MIGKLNVSVGHVMTIPLYVSKAKFVISPNAALEL